MLLQLENIVRRWAGKRVAVVGDVMLDVFLDLEPTGRDNPEDGAPIYRPLSRQEFLGGAGNAAANIVSLGGEVSLLGAVGEDHAATRVDELMQQAGVHDGLIIDLDRATTVKVRLTQPLCRIDVEQTGPLSTNLVPAGEALPNMVRDAAEWADGVLLSDYGKGVMQTPGVATAARLVADVVHLDPKASVDGFPEVECVTPNAGELHQLGGDILPEACVGRLQQELGQACQVVVTRGRLGAAICHRTYTTRIFTEPVLRDVHPAGAGDTFAAALLLARLAGAPWPDAVVVANAAARAAVLQPGVTRVTAEDVLQQLPLVAARRS